MVESDLSKFSILVTARLISFTIPWTLYLETEIQSPTLMLFEEAICKPETNPRIESLKINKIIAVNAPKTVRISETRVSISVAMKNSATKKATKILNIRQYIRIPT